MKNAKKLISKYGKLYGRGEKPLPGYYKYLEKNASGQKRIMSLHKVGDIGGISEPRTTN